jgi:hypothetical protein
MEGEPPFDAATLADLTRLHMAHRVISLLRGN